MSPRPAPARRRTPAAALLALVLAATAIASPVTAQVAVESPTVAAPATDAAAQVAPARSLPAQVLDPWLVDQLAAAAPTERLHAMVHAADAGSLADAVAAVRAVGMVQQDAWERIGVVVAIGTPAQIRAVGEQPGVVYVEGNQPLEHRMTTSHTATRGDVARTLTTPDGTPVDGTGVSIGIVDSGVDGDHPMFRLPDGTSKVARNLEINPVCNFLVPQGTTTNTACIVDNPTNRTDTSRAGGHGTHVAGTAAGVDVVTSDGRELHGAAPGATIISLATGGAIAVLGANHGLNWILENHANPCAGNLTQPALQECAPIRSTNHSYGPLGGGSFNPNSATTLLQDALLAEGVVQSWAAGNDGGDGSADVTNPSGKNPRGGILMVASYDDAGTGTRDGSTSSFSSRGRAGAVDTYPDLSAPGSNITSACAPTLPICQSFEADLNYGTISGTSMATPHIAGIVAQVLQADPSLTPAEVEDVLEDTAHEFAGGAAYEPDTANDGLTSFDKGHGLVDAAAAVAQVLGVTDPEGPAVEGCLPDDPQVTDPAGDANAVLGAPLLPVNQPALDIVEARLTADPTTSDVTFTVTVADLPDTPGGTSGEGEHIDFNFSVGGAAYYLTMTRTASEGESFALGDFGGQNGLRRTLATGLQGSFDPAAETISAVLPAGLLASAAGGQVIAQGTTFTGLEVIARYSLVFVVPDADSATGTCPFTVGDAVVDDPDPEPVVPDLTIDGASAMEAGGTMTFDVRLSEAADQAVSVSFATEDGTATAGEDHEATSGTLTFEPGQTTRTITVPVIDDQLVEGDETFLVVLSDPDGVTLLTTEATGTIVDDDVAEEPPAEDPKPGNGGGGNGGGGNGGGNGGGGRPDEPGRPDRPAIDL